MTDERARAELDLLRDDVEQLNRAAFPSPKTVQSAVNRTLTILEHLIEKAECDGK